MKVAHIITRLIIGGAQENTLFNVQDQQELFGDEVTLITGPGVGPEGSLVEKGLAAGLDIRVVEAMKRNLHPLHDWISYRQLIRLLRDYRPQLVHTHSSKAGIIGRAAAAKLGIPAVHSIHGASFHRGQNPILHRAYISAEKWAAKRCEKFISVCDAMSDQYVAAGIAAKEKFATIYSGFDVDAFLRPKIDPQEKRTELGIAPEHIVIGKIARLFHLKGHEFVIEAAKKVIERIPQVRFLFVGDGILKSDYEKRIAELGLTEHFIFTGLVPPDEISDYIHAMDIVVHTSLWEGLARVLPQALIAGKPVISYDIDGAKEVVIPNETGYLLPPESVEELSQAMIELAEDAELRRRFGTAGREKFTEQFRHENMTAKIREVYREILEL